MDVVHKPESSKSAKSNCKISRKDSKNDSENSCNVKQQNGTETNKPENDGIDNGKADKSVVDNTKKIRIVPLERLLENPSRAAEIKAKLKDTPEKDSQHTKSRTQGTSNKLNNNTKSSRRRLPVRQNRSKASVIDLLSSASSTNSSSSEEDSNSSSEKDIVKKSNHKGTVNNGSKDAKCKSTKESIKLKNNTKVIENGETSKHLSELRKEYKIKRCVVRVKRLNCPKTNDKKSRKQGASDKPEKSKEKEVKKEKLTNAAKKQRRISSSSCDSNSIKKKSDSDFENDKDPKVTKESENKKKKMASTASSSMASRRKRAVSDSDSDFDITEAAANAVNNFSDENDDVDEVAGERGKEDEKSAKNSENSSDTGSEVVTVRKKRVFNKKKSNDSDDSDFEPSTKAKKAPGRKRRRIKSNSDSGSDSDDEKKKNKTKRKQIHKIIRSEDLNIDTKTATKEEQERRKRIEERQKLYNQIYQKPESAEVTELILDFDEDTKKPLLTVDSGILKKLKPHQVTGVKFMWEACFETVEDAQKKPGSGCILAHCMGLGKTLQIVTLSHTLLISSRKTLVERVLVISPLSTLNNWAREFKHWTSFARKKDIEIYDMSRYKDKATRIFKLDEWFHEGGVCVMGYDMFRILANEKAKGLRKKQREQLQQALIDPGPDLVICDEGHLLKNEKTSISKAVTRLRTKRRIVLTGTPLQNNMKEYYCMIQFVKPNLLGTYKEYLNRFVNPITNGQYTDSTERDIRLMKHRSHILHKMLEGCIQRRDYSVLAPYLPPKYEYVVYTQLSDVQKQLYEFYMVTQRELISSDISGKGARLFQDFQDLRRIWTHPMNLRVNSDTVIRKRTLANDEDSMDDFICDEDEESDDGGPKKKGGKAVNEETSDSNDSIDSSKSFPSDAGEDLSGFAGGPTRKTRSRRNGNNADDASNDGEESDLETHQATADQDDPSEWWKRFVDEKELNNINHSPKLIILMRLLQRCETIGDKVLVFSQSLQSLDVIEHFLKLIDLKTKGKDVDADIGEFKGTWQPNVDYFRLDGSSSVDNRDDMCKRFNDVKNLRARLFLISTRAGGLGINLVAANRVVIFDVSWNPSHDTQSIFRVYRFGQTKPSYIYRLIAMGTMEQKVYERQVIKQATAKRVIDEQQITRHYNSSDLQELYSYELTPLTEREIPILPKDRLFAELLSDLEKMIFKYHDHDSLLENEESENLSEEERKAAWSEYEAEKTRATQAQQYISYDRGAFGNLYANMTAGVNQSGNVTSNRIFGFRSDILLQLLNMKIAKDCPEMNQNQVIQLVPTYLQRLYNEMNNGDPTMYKDLLQLHSTISNPSGMYMSPLLYANQNPQSAGYQQKGIGGLGGQPQSVIVDNAGSSAGIQPLGFNAEEVYELSE